MLTTDGSNAKSKFLNFDSTKIFEHFVQKSNFTHYLKDIKIKANLFGQN